MTNAQDGSGRWSRVGFIAAAVILFAAAALWFSGVLDRATVPEPATGAATKVPAPVPPAPPANAVSERLVPILTSARDAAEMASAVAREAQPIAAKADAVAAEAAKMADKGKTAATEARQAAAKACKSPSATLVCADAADGTHYAGAQSCKGDQGCGPDGYGVLSDKKNGWVSEGEWRDWSLVLGCDSVNGAITYCGQQASSAWSGFGVSYNANDAAIAAEWLKGAARNPLRLDYPSGSRMRGEMKKYELDGLGVYDRNDGRVLSGRWQAGKLISGVVTYPGTGDVFSGSFADGNAQLGTVAYKDGRMFVGRIEDSPALAEALPAEGVIYSPAGAIIQQGTWKGGLYAGN